MKARYYLEGHMYFSVRDLVNYRKEMSDEDFKEALHELCERFYQYGAKDEYARGYL